MPYCQECGSYMEQDTNACGSCGSKLNLAWETGVSTIDTQSNPVENAAASPQTPNGPGDNNLEPRVLYSENIIDASQPTPTGIPNSLGQQEDDLVDYSGNAVNVSQSMLTELQNAMEKREFDTGDYTKAIPQGPERDDRIVGPDANQFFEEGKVELVHRESFNYGSHRNQAESHLGKGLIKPVEIENCMDGFHFRYDQPQRQINRVEPQDEKIVEFRVSGEAQSRNLNSAIGENILKQEAENLINESDETIENINQVKDSKEETITIQKKSELEFQPEIYPEDSGGEDKNLIEETQVEENVILEERLEPEKPDIESELEFDSQPKILWEGHRSWNGLPLRETYQLTDHSVVVSNGNGVKIKEIEWPPSVVFVVKQNWFAKLINIGNLEIGGPDFELSFVLEGIENPEQLRKTLVEILESKV